MMLLGGFSLITLYNKTNVYVTRKSSAYGWHLNDGLVSPIERKAVDFLMDKLSSYERPCVVDAHSGVGEFALIAAAMPGVRFMCMEPHPHLFEYLIDNLDENGIRDRVSVFMSAAYNDSRAINLIVPDDIGKRTVCPKEGGDVILVDGRKIDFLLGIRRIDVIRLSTGGAEFIALQGAEVTIDTYKPDLMIKVNGKRSYITSSLEHKGYLWETAPCDYIWAEVPEDA